MPALPRLLCLILLLAAPALAQPGPDPHRPTAEERAWLRQCLEGVEADFPRAGFDRCARRLTGACLGLEEADTPRLRQPAGRNSHPRSCAPIEATVWDEAMNRWYREALDALPAAAQDALRRGQRAWIGYRDAACLVDPLVVPGFLGGDLAADCRLESVATRALELRRLAALAKENR